MFRGRLSYSDIMEIPIYELEYLISAQEEILIEKAKHMQAEDLEQELN